MPGVVYYLFHLSTYTISVTEAPTNKRPFLGQRERATPINSHFEISFVPTGKVVHGDNMLRQNDSPEKGKTIKSSLGNPWRSLSSPTSNEAVTFRQVLRSKFTFATVPDVDETLASDVTPLDQQMDNLVEKIKHIRLPEKKIKSVIDDPEQCRTLKQQLRQTRLCLTEASVKAHLHHALSDRINDISRKTKNVTISPVSVTQVIHLTPEYIDNVYKQSSMNLKNLHQIRDDKENTLSTPSYR